MKKLTQFINEALGDILPREFMKIWKGQHVNIDDDHLKNSAYVFTELMNVHRDKLPTTEEFTNMCRWFVDTYKDQPYVTEEYVEELLYRFFDTFVQRTQKKTFTKEIKHTKFIELGGDLFKREISYEYLTKTLRRDVEIDSSGHVENFDGYEFDNIPLDDRMERISSRLSCILYMGAKVKRQLTEYPYINQRLFLVYERPIKDFLKRWKISLEDFINKHDYSEGTRIMGKMFKK